MKYHSGEWWPLGEGPFETREAAELFIHAEVGVKARARKTSKGWAIEYRPCRPDRIRAWVEREFNPAHVERVFQEFLDVATGATEGNNFVKKALAAIFAWDKTFSL